MRRVRIDDAGFTLPELLVAITVIGLIMPALVAAFVAGVKTTTGTTERLSASNDATFTSTWFVPDVQSADEFSTTGEACFGTGTVHLAMKRVDGPDTIVTAYATEGDATPDRTLVRYSCTNGVANPTVTVSHELKETVDPNLTCTPSPCSGATSHIALAVSVEDGTVDGYTFNLNATRRTS